MKTEPIVRRALSIRQPYVEMILRGDKKIEYRSRLTKIRERVYLYASKQPGERQYFDDLGLQPGDLPTGVLVGTVEVVDCTQIGHRSYEWHLANPYRLTRLIEPETKPQPAWFYPFTVLRPAR